jgi:glycerate kinase
MAKMVRGPLGQPVAASFAIDDTAAIVEMSSASGLLLVANERRDPLRATTFGTGELIRAALDAGAQRILIGIGGSATNDAGAGMLQALGARLLNAAGEDIDPGGAHLGELATIDLAGLDARLKTVAIDVAADVDNPLCGPDGASAVFGPQKGATPGDVRNLDDALAHFADVAAVALGVDHRNESGAGAAGGLGFALRAFLHARLRPGVEIVAELRGLSDALVGATAACTGEGSIDRQTLAGKTVAGVARLAHAAGVTTIVAFGGRVDDAAAAALRDRYGVTTIALAEEGYTLERAMSEAARLLERAARDAALRLMRMNGSSR